MGDGGTLRAGADGGGRSDVFCRLGVSEGGGSD